VDAIVSQPATLTGSIGVFAVRPAIGPLLDRLDIHSAVLQRAPHAELNLMTPPLSPDTVEWLQRDVHRVYDTFLSRVAEGRHLEVAKVADVAQGHVWTGAQALERGLVDQTGGLRAAVEEAKRRAGIASDADVDLHVFPPPRPLAEQIAEAFQTRIAESASAALPWAPERWQAAWGRTAGWLAALSVEGTALVPPFWVEIH